MDNFEIGIIGAGVAGAFAAWRISERFPKLKTIIFDLGRPPGKRRRQLEGWFGCFPCGDGKLYPDDLAAVSQLVDQEQLKIHHQWVMGKLEQVNSSKIIIDSLPTSALQDKIAGLNFKLKNNNYVQWKPEHIHKLAKCAADAVEKQKNIQLSCDNEVYSITKEAQHFVVSTAEGKFCCRKLIICAGRSGWRWVSELYRDLGLVHQDDYATFGVRAEIPAQYVREFNRSHCLLSKDGLEIGPFSWYGSVIPEDHADLVISSFRSNEERWKSQKVSFSILSTKYFKDQGTYQTERLGKLAFLLFNDRVSRERIRTYLKRNSQLSLLPEYDEWLTATLAELQILIPELYTFGSFHVPNIVPLATKVKLSSTLESEQVGLFVAGESAGIKGILAACLTGSLAADSAGIS